MENLNPIKINLNRIYYTLFVEYFRKKINFKFSKKIFRWNLIQKIINKNKYKSYLEIGCNDDELFSKIKISRKIGVDPEAGGTHRLTSDLFFKKNTKKFDIIFIDGLHHYDQVKKDVKNSLKYLNKNGFILLHDCLPESQALQAVPRYRGRWNGDVWKAIVEFRTKKNLNIFTCRIDQGISIIKKGKNKNIIKLKNTNFKELKFKDFYYHHKKYMNILNYKDTLKILKIIK